MTMGGHTLELRAHERRERDCEDGAKGGDGAERSLFLAPLRNSLVLSSSPSSFRVLSTHVLSQKKKVVVREKGVLRPLSAGDNCGSERGEKSLPFLGSRRVSGFG